MGLSSMQARLLGLTNRSNTVALNRSHQSNHQTSPSNHRKNLLSFKNNHYKTAGHRLDLRS